MALKSVSRAQVDFMRDGGILRMPLQKMYEDGVLSPDYVFREYPKAIRVPRGAPEKIEKSVTMVDGKVRTWTEIIQAYDEYTVASEAEEERILSGGKTNAQIEEEKEGLFQRCRAAGISADPGWSVVRLRRELGDALDAPPGDELADLKAKLTRLEEIAAMKAKIAALEAQVSVPAASTSNPLHAVDFGDDPDELRGQLTALGVAVDRRWGHQRLRDELDRATAPGRGV